MLDSICKPTPRRNLIIVLNVENDSNLQCKRRGISAPMPECHKGLNITRGNMKADVQCYCAKVFLVSKTG